MGVGVQQRGCLSVTHPVHHRPQIQITRNHNACVGMPQTVDANTGYVRRYDQTEQETSSLPSNIRTLLP